MATTANGSANLMLDPALPTTIAGKPMRLSAVTACWDDTHADMVITAVTSRRSGRTQSANLTNIVELEDPNDQDAKTCKRYDFAAPVILAGNSRVNLKLSVGWAALNAPLHSVASRSSSTGLNAQTGP